MNNTVLAVVAFAIFAVGGVLHFAFKEPELRPVSGRAATLTRATLARTYGERPDALDIAWRGAVSLDTGTAVCGTRRDAGGTAPFAVLFFTRAGTRGRAVLEPGRPGWDTLPAACRQ